MLALKTALFFQTIYPFRTRNSQNSMRFRGLLNKTAPKFVVSSSMMGGVFTSGNVVAAAAAAASGSAHGAVTSAITHVAVTTVAIASGACLSTKANNLRVMLLGMDDPHVVLIKLADRLHNMRTIYALPSPKAQSVAQETLVIWCSLASRLGLWALKAELEDLCFAVLQPQTFRQMRADLASMWSPRNRVGNLRRISAKAILLVPLNQESLTSDSEDSMAVDEMKRKDVSINKVYDASALRVIVGDKNGTLHGPAVQCCYSLLDIIHRLWTPIDGEFDDYIVNPKPSGYQSMHTAVQGPDSSPLEVQI